MDVACTFDTSSNQWQILFTKDNKYVGYSIPSRFNESEEIIKLMAGSFSKVYRAFHE